MTVKLSDTVEAMLERICWVDEQVSGYDFARTDQLVGLARASHTREAHAECEALREQIREVVRAALDENRNPWEKE
jgi:hypothetical protein